MYSSPRKKGTNTNITHKNLCHTIKLPVSILIQITMILTALMKKITKTLGLGSQGLSRGSNRMLTEYYMGILPLHSAVLHEHVSQTKLVLRHCLK
jgi:hypothetical protein